MSISFLPQLILCSPYDDHFEKFEIETVGICGAMIKRSDEITEMEARKGKYRNGRASFINCETNKNEYVYVFFCSLLTILIIFSQTRVDV